MPKYRVISTFTPQGEGEISIFENEVIEATEHESGSGWHYGTNVRGQDGFFPSSYLEPVVEHAFNDDYIPEPRHAPPPPPPNFDEHVTNWAPPPMIEEDDIWGDEFPSDTESTVSAKTSHSAPNTQPNNNATKVPKKKGPGLFGGQFKSTGLFDFIHGNMKVSAAPKEEFWLDVSPEGTYWKLTGPKYKITVNEPVQRSKHVLKSFMEYKLDNSLTGQSVTRRYKHFDWLMAQLQKKFIFCTIPDLPEKQVTGRFEASFIAYRVQRLQDWLDRMTAHPVISQSIVMKHFLTCPAEGADWKRGKRAAENDDFQRARFFLAVKLSNEDVEHSESSVDMLYDELKRFVRFNSNMSKVLGNISQDIRVKLNMNPNIAKHGFSDLATCLKHFKHAVDTSEHPNFQYLSTALSDLSDVLEQCGKRTEAMNETTVNPFLERILHQRSMVKSIADSVALCRDAIREVMSLRKAEHDNKATRSQVVAAEKACTVVCHALMAERNWLFEQQVAAFDAIIRSYVESQALYHEQCANLYRRSLANFAPSNGAFESSSGANGNGSNTYGSYSDEAMANMHYR